VLKVGKNRLKRPSNGNKELIPTNYPFLKMVINSFGLISNKRTEIIKHAAVPIADLTIQDPPKSCKTANKLKHKLMKIKYLSPNVH
jgi:hypothetical protein